MLRVSSDTVAQRLDELVHLALTQSVVIEKPRHETVVMLSLDEFERLQALDDAYLAGCARRANKEGYVDHDHEIRQRLAAAMNARRLGRHGEPAVQSDLEREAAANTAPAGHH
ncbi:hypothetical protein [Rugamonas sp.]|uniref:hypothetical protein n=1 Tax=Rugamonas sp. TaxID=1926287 RepID=UPI0025E299DE|nr:hypothetical protein [Rugamonas sp.]